MATSPGEQKFRPYFTAAELLLIIRTLKSAPAPALGLIRYLETFSIKIERGVVAPQITLQESLESRLGLSTVPAPAESTFDLVNVWQFRPDLRPSFTPAQLETIQAHRYERGLMSPEEESEYEKSIGM